MKVSAKGWIMGVRAAGIGLEVKVTAEHTEGSGKNTVVRHSVMELAIPDSAAAKKTFCVGREITLTIETGDRVL